VAEQSREEVNPMNVQLAPVQVTVPGPPRPKSRPRFTKTGRPYSVKSQVIQEEAIAWALRAKMGHRRFEGDVHVWCRFFCKNKQHGDLDNLEKLALDAANGIAYKDDRQVKECRGRIDIDKANPRTVIRIFCAPTKEDR
jgi:Holliday junction resolvase RusA-like endonuclease